MSRRFVTVFPFSQPDMPLHINVDHIVSITPNPDDAENSTIVALSTGKTIQVGESTDDILSQVGDAA